jgi:hypothetical protein
MPTPNWRIAPHGGQSDMASPVEHADVTVLSLGAGVDPPAVASNGVAVEIQGDVC